MTCKRPKSQRHFKIVKFSNVPTDKKALCAVVASVCMGGIPPVAAVVAPPGHAAAMQVSGATGSNAARINGVYRPVAGERVGGRPVYKKDGAADIRIEYLEYRPGRKQWMLKHRLLPANNAYMYLLCAQKEAGVVVEVTAGW
jgi:hypothetical protein